MGVVMKKNVKGVAGLFDALFFLAVVSVVSVALLAAMDGSDDVIDGRGQDMVDAAHLVLLRSTLPNGSNNTYSIEEMVRAGNYQDALHRENVSETLDLLLPGMEWAWTVVKDGETYRLGGTVGSGVDVFCSIIRSPCGSEEVMFRLEAWRA
jgi:hypothetical protein